MEADATPTPWSKICISHADCILLVGASDALPEVTAPAAAACRCCTLQAADSARWCRAAAIVHPIGISASVSSLSC